jgi:hypothetical protein
MVAKRASLLLLPAALAACSWQGPSLAGYPGLQWKVVSYYDSRALEKSAACPQPRMDAVQARVVDENEKQVVMTIRYHWYDDTQSSGSDNPLFPGGGILGYCNDWGERTFTFAKRTDGNLDVIGMSGPQRDRPNVS